MIFAILMKIAVFSVGNGPCLSLSRKNMNTFSLFETFFRICYENRLYILRIRIFQRGKISGSRTVDHKILSTYTFTKCKYFMLRNISGESISYPKLLGSKD